MSIVFLSLMNSSPAAFIQTWLPLLLPLAIVELVLILVALVDLIRRAASRVRGSKLVWVLVILFISTLGPICYLLLGRKEQTDV